MAIHRAGAVDQPNPVEIQRAAESNPTQCCHLGGRYRGRPSVRCEPADAGAVPSCISRFPSSITAIDFYCTNVSCPELVLKLLDRISMMVLLYHLKRRTKTNQDSLCLLSR